MRLMFICTKLVCIKNISESKGYDLIIRAFLVVKNAPVVDHVSIIDHLLEKCKK